MSNWLIYGIGIVAQGLFTVRMLVQWIASERAKRVLSPTLFWQLSMAGSLLLCVYGWLRNDFAIVLGQLISYYVYIWNLNAKGSWQKLPAVARAVFISIPIAALGWFTIDWGDTAEHLFEQPDIPMWLIIYGVAGQITFTLRFVYQWWYSCRKGESLLPPIFWIISLTGSAMIVSYAVIRRDPVLILGQIAGFVVYTRNLMIAYRCWREDIASATPEQR